jgi:hypothetical protein
MNFAVVLVQMIAYGVFRQASFYEDKLQYQVLAAMQCELLARVPKEPRLNSLAYIAAAARWRKRRVDSKLTVDFSVDSWISRCNTRSLLV